jgi:hypothetical protein
MAKINGQARPQGVARGRFRDRILELVDSLCRMAQQHRYDLYQTGRQINLNSPLDYASALGARRRV